MAQDLDTFKEEVYKAIGMLESFDDGNTENLIRTTNGGCLGFFFNNLFGKFAVYANKVARKKMKIDELTEQAEELLAKKEFMELICENLDAKVVLLIDAAYKLTPVLYNLTQKDEKSFL